MRPRAARAPDRCRCRSVTRRRPVPSARTIHTSRNGQPLVVPQEREPAAVGRPDRRRRRRADQAGQRGDALDREPAASRGAWAVRGVAGAPSDEAGDTTDDERCSDTHSGTHYAPRRLAVRPRSRLHWRRDACVRLASLLARVLVLTLAVAASPRGRRSARRSRRATSGRGAPSTSPRRATTSRASSGPTAGCPTGRRRRSPPAAPRSRQFERRWRAIDAVGLAGAAPGGLPARRLGDRARALGARRRRRRGGATRAFYIQQALGPVFDLLLPPPPFDAARAPMPIARPPGHVPPHRRAGAGQPRRRAAALRARWRSTRSTDIDARLATVARGARRRRARATRGPLRRARGRRGRRARRLPQPGSRRASPAMPADTAVGREAYIALPARGGAGAVHARRTAGDGPPGVGARRGLRGARAGAQPRAAADADLPRPGRRRSRRRPAGRSAIRAFLERERAADGAGVDAALPEPAAAGVSRAARLPRRHRRPHQRHAAEGGRLQLHPRAVAGPAVLLPVHRARPAADHRARGRARPLPAAGAGVGAREPDPPPLLRLGRQRRHRLLRRGDDAAGGAVGRQPALARDHLQLRAACARCASRST